MSRRLTAIASATPRSSDSMPGIRRRRVDEHDDRPAELLRQPHRAQRLAVALRPRVAEVAEDLLLGVAALDVADEQHRLALVVGEAGHDRVIVGEAAVAVDLGEPGEQPLDEVLEARPVRDGARPARAATASATCRARARTDSMRPLQRLDLAIARVGLRQHASSASISFSSDGDRLFEVERFRHGHERRSSQLHRPGADDLLHLGDQRRRGPHADLRADVDPHAQPAAAARRFRLRTTPSGRRGGARRSRRALSSIPRSAGILRWIATSRASRSRTLSSGAISDARIRTDSSSRSSLPRTSTSVPVSISAARALIRLRKHDDFDAADARLRA